LKTSAEGIFQAVAHEFDGFHHHLVDVNTCKCALSWWCIHEQKHLVVGMLARQILGIPTSQTETERIFSIAGIPIAFPEGIVCKLTTLTK
jgi:hypothetical protein